MAKKNENAKTCAILSYWLIGIIWYFVDETIKKDEFAKHHVKQGLTLLLGSIAVIIAVQILTVISFGILSLILFPLMMIFNIAVLVLAIIGTIAAANGEKKELPVVGKYAKKYFKF